MTGRYFAKGETSWTEIEQMRLRRLCAHTPALSWRQIAHIIGRPISGCHGMAVDMGFRKPRCRPREKWKEGVAA